MPEKAGNAHTFKESSQREMLPTVQLSATAFVGKPWAVLLAGVAMNEQLKEGRTQSAVFNQ